MYLFLNFVCSVEKTVRPDFPCSARPMTSTHMLKLCKVSSGSRLVAISLLFLIEFQPRPNQARFSTFTLRDFTDNKQLTGLGVWRLVRMYNELHRNTTGELWLSWRVAKVASCSSVDSQL